jgi:hypothetical protein
MKLLLTALLVSCASPALAAQCFHHEDDPSWTITLNDPGVQPEVVWKQGDVVKEGGTGSAGTGIAMRVLYVDEEGYKFRFYKDVLIVDSEVYEPGCD